MTLLNNKTLLACALGLAFGVADAATSPTTPATSACIDLRGSGEAGRLDLVRGKSVLKRFCTPASQVTVGAPEVANVVVPNANEVVIVARSIGTTNLIVSGRDGRSTVLDLVVGIDTAPLRAQFDTLFPQEKDIRIGSTGNALVLSGMVADAEVASQLMALANAFQEGGTPAAGAGAGAGSPAPAGVGAPAAPAAAGATSAPKVLNMLTVAAPQQVMLEVKIAEVSKSLVDKLGAAAGYSKISGGWTYSLLSNLLTSGAGMLTDVKANGTKQFAIDGENRDGLVKILAEPTVMAISGQEASFLAGGKIFIPVAQNSVGGAPTITLEEKEYGVAVKFKPTVLANGRINLRVAPEVSELNREGIGVNTNGSTSATAILPAFTTRRATTTVQLQDGQSFAIGGLIRNNVTSNIKRFPLLGDVPILGTLFRSSDFQNDRTELVFIVTPRLAKPLPDAPRLPTDDYRQPTRAQFLLNGQHEDFGPAAPSKEKP
ncbi:MULTISPECIES: type II and III secretion system protein family protein [unclassified Massilia]|uniref:type II and III secretion system protein family protein n=1 Tax=unclassified Massilia TaxID=2609279 RepID=UPI001782C319|nr:MULTISPECIES: type II and III secretion system protein family protein [unclassified Massilia]MBD8530938.1 type II and III secretion system protein family protein [Massilia sp. CFBP 13647]MBD8674649.1 type II and III secretion system protein family protein [Massilia sp. CFBP 13721]